VFFQFQRNHETRKKRTTNTISAKQSWIMPPIDNSYMYSLNRSQINIRDRIFNSIHKCRNKQYQNFLAWWCQGGVDTRLQGMKMRAAKAKEK